jgi:SAM-dependent methyltransferase
MNDPLPLSAQAFDRVADRYDQDSTDQPISRWVRGRVHGWLADLFKPGDHVLELGCGTGEDALHLAGKGIRVTATDASHAMLTKTAEKATAYGLKNLITTQPLNMEETSWQLPQNAFDGVFSNYGALNCVGPSHWANMADQLWPALRPGARLGFVVINRFCLWELAWHALHGDLHTARRRWSGQTETTIAGTAFTVYYPSARAFRACFRRYALRKIRGLGIFIPPSDVYGALARFPRLAKVLMVSERLSEPLMPMHRLADQFWLALQKPAAFE